MGFGERTLYFIKRKTGNPENGEKQFFQGPR